MNDIHIKQLTENDWQIYRAMRLRALSQNGDVFMSTYDKEAAKADAEWQATLRDKSCAVFGLYDGDKAIGLTGIFTYRADESGKTAVLAMSFIDAAYRGRGMSQILYEARINWAKDKASFDKIRVSHRAGNEASRRANQAFGFKCVGSEDSLWPDGKQDKEHIYELRLRN